MERTCESLSRYGYTEFRREPHHDLVLPAILDLFPRREGLAVLDVGCGTGVIARELANLGCSVTGIDVAEDGIAIARAQVPNVHFAVASAYDDWSEIEPDGGWDLVLAVEVIEHLYAPQRFLQNAWRMLKPDGSIILTTPYHGYIKNMALSVFNGWDRHFTVHREGGHIKFFSPKTLSEILRASGFENAAFRYVGRTRAVAKSMVCRASKPSC